MEPKKIIFAIAVSVCVAAVGIAYIINDGNSNSEERNIILETVTSDEVTKTHTENTDIYVYVCGNVNNPGIVCVKQGDRIYRAIELAGGMGINADINAINQADFVQDGQKIYIPAIGEQYIPENDSEGNNLVNINTADVTELTTLPGIGQSRAESIIKYRDNNGAFVAIEDIMKVAGIKEAAFEKIKDYICV